MIEIIFYTICVWVSYRMNKALHQDIFPKRQWTYVSEVDGKEYIIEEM